MSRAFDTVLTLVSFAVLAACVLVAPYIEQGSVFAFAHMLISVVSIFGLCTGLIEIFTQSPEDYEREFGDNS